MKLTLSRMYVEDALVERDLDIGDVVKWNKRTVVLECTQEQIAEIQSDATYYSTTQGMDWGNMHAYAQAAKSVLRAIDKRLTNAAFSPAVLRSPSE